jgi:thioredoxin reductase
MPKLDSQRVVIIGAGPIGIEAALYARTLGHEVTVFERNQVGANVRQWGHVRLFSPFGMNATPLGKAAIRASNPKHEFPADAACTTGREFLAAYLEPLAKSDTLHGCIRPDAQIIAIGRRGCLKSDGADDPKRTKQPFRLLVRDNKNKETIEEADDVLDCTGTYGRHRWAGDGGIPAIGERAAEASMAYTLEDVSGERRGYYAGKTVLVIGAGYSAATTVCSLAELAERHPETWIIWLARGSATAPLHRHANDSLRERDRLAVRANTLATRGEGVVEFHNQTVIESIESLGQDKGFRVSARVAGKPRTFDADRVIANVGYMPDMAMLRELHVQNRFGPDDSPIKTARQPELNLFILGAKSFGLNSQFLLGDGFNQIRDVFAMLSGKAGLDLYRSPSRLM